MRSLNTEGSRGMRSLNTEGSRGMRSLNTGGSRGMRFHVFSGALSDFLDVLGDGRQPRPLGIGRLVPGCHLVGMKRPRDQLNA